MLDTQRLVIVWSMVATVFSLAIDTVKEHGGILTALKHGADTMEEKAKKLAV